MEGNQLRVDLQNTLFSPLRIQLVSFDPQLQDRFDSLDLLLLSPGQDTVLFFDEVNDPNPDVRFSSILGDLNYPTNLSSIGLPFQVGKTYQIVQAYNSMPTHNSNYSRYAIDFNLAVNDTICAATDGYVVGVVKDFKYGGPGPEWRRFGNFITIFDPISGLYTQYAHLVHKGSFVKVGDRVKRGDPIGLSGMTGQTNIQHLHFNCLIPVDSEDGLISVPIEFLSGYKGVDLRRGDFVTNKYR